MRNVLISLAAAGTAFIVAAPASAQYMPQRPGYGGSYGNSYGYNGYGQARALHARIDSIEHSIGHLGRAHRISSRTADQLRRESRQIERRLRASGYNGLNPYEANDIERRIARLEQRVSFAMNQRYGRGWGGNGYGNGYRDNYGNGNYGYRDRDDDDRDGHRDGHRGGHHGDGDRDD